jgi:hypothetical protein
LNSRAHRQFCSANTNHDPEVDALFRKFLTQVSFAEFLAACCSARPGFLDDLSLHPLFDGLDNYSDDDDDDDDDDGADILTPHTAPPVPSLRFYVSVSRTQRGSLLCALCVPQ